MESDDFTFLETSKGGKFWFKGKHHHRVDGPAIVYPDGTKFWLQNDQFHRADGPAVELHNGEKYWWLNGDEYDPLEWLLKVHELGLK